LSRKGWSKFGTKHTAVVLFLIFWGEEEVSKKIVISDYFPEKNAVGQI